MRGLGWGAIGLCAALAAPWAALADTQFRVEPAALLDSNVTNGHVGADVKSDFALSLAASISQFWALTGADFLSIGLNLKDSQYQRYHGLSDFEVGPFVTYRRKLGYGAAAPWVALNASWAYQDYIDHTRRGNLSLIQVSAGQRWGRFDGSAGLAYDRRAAGGGEAVAYDLPGDAFDLHGYSGFVRLGMVLCGRWQAGLRLSLRRGDVEASTHPNLQVYQVSEAITEDPVFGEEFYAYRVKGDTFAVGSTLTWALNDVSSLNLAGTWDHTSAGGFTYDGGKAQLSYVYHY